METAENEKLQCRSNTFGAKIAHNPIFVLDVMRSVVQTQMNTAQISMTLSSFDVVKWLPDANVQLAQPNSELSGFTGSCLAR